MRSAGKGAAAHAWPPCASRFGSSLPQHTELPSSGAPPWDALLSFASSQLRLDRAIPSAGARSLDRHAARPLRPVLTPPCSAPPRKDYCTVFYRAAFIFKSHPEPSARRGKAPGVRQALSPGLQSPEAPAWAEGRPHGAATPDSPKDRPSATRQNLYARPGPTGLSALPEQPGHRSGRPSRPDISARRHWVLWTRTVGLAQ